jgi:predicted phage terminase large subunit-like protein
MGHEWVKARFKIPHRRPEGIWQVPSCQRVWVPAMLDDNPALDADEYRESLAELDPVTRAQMLAGDWNIQFEGELFRRAWFPLKDVAPITARRVRYWDLAGTAKKATNDPDWTVGLKLARTSDGRFFIEDVQRLRATPGEVKKLIREIARADGRAVDIWIEQEPGSSGLAVVEDYIKYLAGWTVHGLRSTGSKIERAKPVSSQAEAGNIDLLNAGFADSLLNELTLFPQEGVHDDQVDALSGAFQALVNSTPRGIGHVAGVGVRGWTTGNRVMTRRDQRLPDETGDLPILPRY